VFAFALFAKIQTMVSQNVSLCTFRAEYYLPHFYFWPKLNHPARQFICGSWQLVVIALILCYNGDWSSFFLHTTCNMVHNICSLKFLWYLLFSFLWIYCVRRRRSTASQWRYNC